MCWRAFSITAGGIVARHISTVRWTKAPSLPAFGGDNSKTRTAGEVILEARYKGKLIATAKVLLRDPPIGQARADAVVEAWRRRS